MHGHPGQLVAGDVVAFDEVVEVTRVVVVVRRVELRLAGDV